MTMADGPDSTLRAFSARPAMTADLMARTSLDDAVLDRLVRCFYGRVRQDELLAPIFAAAIDDWEPHLARMVDFWSSVALMTGRYHGRPMQKHLPLPLEARHFERWLELFRSTAEEVCPREGASHVIAAAERIAHNMRANREYHRQYAEQVGPPVLRERTSRTMEPAYSGLREANERTGGCGNEEAWPAPPTSGRA
jgi:hemoglobin